ncbi:hypothetical protein LCGC14_0795000 [marine sediment metagenome]|uniref:Uncharacterized protein n=1 Tax=marine sediment metagenome TaxID=412755 RepID=A0A0F9SYP3_9ZZZZ
MNEIKCNIKSTMVMNSLYSLLDKLKEDIRYWWKINMYNLKIDKKVVNLFKKIVFHEVIHYKIVKNSAKTIDIVLNLKKAEEENIIGFYYDAYCKYTFPYKFNLPKYYPKFIFIEFKHFIFDIICDIFNVAIFTTFRYRLFKFLKCLISFKLRS